MISKMFSFLFSSDNYRERSGIQAGEESLYDYKQRYTIINVIIVFGLCAAAALCPTVLKEGGTVLLVIIQCALSVLLLVSFLLRRFWGGGSDMFYNFYGKLLPVSVLFVLYAMMYYRGGNYGFVGLWVLVTPLIAIFVLGRKTGTIISALMFVWILAAAYIPGRPEHYYSYTLAVTIRIAMVYLGVWVLSFVYEHLRMKNQNQVYRVVSELKAKNEEIEKQSRIIMDGIDYANRIQRNLLPPKSLLSNAFSDHSVIWEPRDVVGGDIYWVKRFDAGAVLCVCDCTGHGTPGALLTMLVTSALESIVHSDNCEDTASIILQIDQRLASAFSVKIDGHEIGAHNIKDGCDLAVLFIANNGEVSFSSAHTNVFICNGKNVQRIRGQRFFIGEGNIETKDDIKTTKIPGNKDNKFYIATDGLFDQPGGKASLPFWYDRFGEIILKNHNEKQSVISGKIWAAFEEYRGSEPRVDDFELITFKV